MNKRYLASMVGAAVAAIVQLTGAQALAQHRDAAPLPQDVIDAVVNRRASPKAELAEQISHALVQMDAVLARHAKPDPKVTGNGASAAQREAYLRLARADIDAQLAVLPGVRQSIQSAFSSKPSLARALASLGRIEQALAQAAKAQSLVELARASQGAQHIVQAQLRLNGVGFVEAGVAPDQPTFRPVEPLLPSNIVRPADRPPAYALQNQNGTPRVMLAAVGDAVLLPTPNEAGWCSYTGADLSKTQEEVNSIKYPELAQLAKSLGYSPARMFDYVSREIRYEPSYPGSLKGAYGTYLTKAGNDFDQASLLIALLRASNIPARYVFGQVEVADPVPMGAEGMINRWLGTKDYAAAKTLNRAGFFPEIVTNAAGQAIGVKSYHMWVQACLPYASYRGNTILNRGHSWVPLDPSYKDLTYQSGIAHSVSFDLNAYLAKRTNGPDSLPHERYLKDIETAIRVSNPGKGLADVPYSGKPKPLMLDVLPSTLPYRVTGFLAPTDQTGRDIVTLPESLRNILRLVMKDAAGTVQIDKTMPMAEALFRRLTIGYKGIDATHQARIDGWRSATSMDSAEPACGTTSVWPTLKADGVEIAAATAGAVDFCSKNSKLEMSITVKLASCSRNNVVVTEGCINSTSYSNMDAANLYSVLAYGFHASDAFIQKRVARLLASIKTSGSNPNAAAFQDDVEGEFLNIVGQKFGRYVSDAADRIAAHSGKLSLVGSHLGLVSARSKISYALDQPFAINRKGFLVDVAGGRLTVLEPDSGLTNVPLMFFANRTASAFESYVWQENAKTDAVSTMRGLQYANETGNTVLKLDAANWAAQNGNLNYTAAEKANLQSHVTGGATVYVPKTYITYDNWKGLVYIAENPTTFAGTYAISGGYNGGYTTSLPITSIYNPVINTGYSYYTPPPAPTFANVVNSYTPPASINSAVNYGGSNGSTYSGDPVNMVTGNMYHNETDIDITVRGGMRMVLQRAYNSRKAADGPLGFGWTHSFNHFLTFRDDNVDGAANAADTDGVTSSVTWTDGSGAEKYIAITSGASASGVATNAVFKTPDGFYFTVVRNADGTYTVNDQGGMSYTFESVAGTKDQRASLKSIKDRNGNTITLAYDTSLRLATVTDGARTLTVGYDGASTRIRDVTDPVGRKHTYQYDGAGNLVKYFKPGQNIAAETPVVAYSYFAAADGANLDHAMKRFTLARGNFMDFVYYPNGRVLSHANAMGESMSFSYNDFRRETVQVNERGMERRFFFDKNGMLLKLVEENLGGREFTYGGVDTADRFKLMEAVDVRGAKTAYTYDAQGNLLNTTRPSGRVEQRSHYNAFGQPGKVKDLRGLYTLMKYDSRGNLLQTIRLKQGYGASIDPATYAPSASEAVAQIASWSINTYDGYGNLQTAKQVRDRISLVGPSMEYGYEATNTYRNKITRRGDKNGDKTIASDEFDTVNLEPNAVGQLTRGVDARWMQVDYTYDSRGRLETATDSSGVTKRVRYDANGNVRQEVASATVNGGPRQLQTASHEYDLADRRTRTMADGLTAAFEYDAAGNLTAQTDPDGRRLTFEYDEMNRVVAAADKEGNRVSKVVDVDGRPLSVTDANGLTTTYTYWDASRDFRVKRVTQPKAAGFANGRAVEYDYDEAGNVTSTKVVPADGGAARETISNYDELNRPLRVVSPVVNDPALGNIRRVTKYTYDVLGRLTKTEAGRTDASGTNTGSDLVTTQASYVYDDFGRKLQDLDGAGRAWKFTYSVSGDVLTTTNPLGKVTTLTWNPNGTLKSRVNEVGTISYTRDVLGLPTRVISTNPAYSQDFAYNGQRRLESVRDSRGGKTLSYEYSPAGQLVAMRDNEGAETNYLYDGAGRLMGLWAPNYDFITFGHDKGGRLTQKWWPNGLKSSYAYEDDGSLKEIVHQATGAQKAKHSYTFDAWGNRKTHTENLSGSEIKYGYEYDALNRLIKGEFTDSSSGTAVTSLMGQYRYDILNNRTRLTDKDGNYLQYIYDNVGGVPTDTGAQQLNQVDLYNAAGVFQSGQASMTYDAAGRLTSKFAGGTSQMFLWDANENLRQVQTSIPVMGGGTAPTVTNYNEVFAYDHEGRRVTRQMVTGSTLYQSMYLYNGQDIHKEYGTWAAPVSVITHGPGEDEPLIHSSATGNRYYHADGLGSPTLLTDVAGNAQAYRRFDPWGRTIGTGGTMPNYGYTGREPDLSTGMMHYRARYYDPTMGRFLSRDPLGLSAGINVYAYVGNNPVNFNDPDGLLAKSVTTTLSNAYNTASTYWDSYQVGTRMQGTAQMLGGFAEVGVGTAVGIGYGWTGIGAVGAGTMMGIGVDNAVAGYRTMISGQSQSSLMDMGLNAAGVNPILAATVGIVASGGTNAGAYSRLGQGVAGRLGREGESAVRAAYAIGDKPGAAILMNGRGRIPDGLTADVISEVKNVKNLSFTQQLRDYSDFAQQTGRRFDLYTRPDTRLSGPLQDAIDGGYINHLLIP